MQWCGMGTPALLPFQPCLFLMLLHRLGHLHAPARQITLQLLSAQ